MKRNMWKILIIAVIVLFGYWVFVAVTAPGKYDDFGKCLRDKGVVMYGTDECGFCKAQKKLFGKSFKYVDYKNCFYDRECGVEGVNSYPTWKINGAKYTGLKSLEELSTLSGCSLE